MKEAYDTKQEGHGIVLTRKNKVPMDALSFLKEKGFKEYSNSHIPASAGHGDKGKLKEVDANEIFILVESGGSSGRLYKVVESVESARNVITELMQDEYAYYFLPIGTSFYVCQDIKEFRVVHSDTE